MDCRILKKNLDFLKISSNTIIVEIQGNSRTISLKKSNKKLGNRKKAWIGRKNGTEKSWNDGIEDLKNK